MKISILITLRAEKRINFQALERNVSLSSQYLEELSRRYKKQVEEMQKLEKTIQSMLDERKKMEDKNQQLEDRLDRLIITMEKWPAFIFWCLTTIIFFGGICWICGGDRQNRRLETSETVKVCSQFKIFYKIFDNKFYFIFSNVDNLLML